METYITKEVFEEYQKFARFRAQAFFFQIEQLRHRIESIEPPKPISIKKRQFYERQIKSLHKRIQYLEEVLARNNTLGK